MSDLFTLMADKAKEVDAVVLEGTSSRYRSLRGHDFSRIWALRNNYGDKVPNPFGCEFGSSLNAMLLQSNWHLVPYVDVWILGSQDLTMLRWNELTRGHIGGPPPPLELTPQQAAEYHVEYLGLALGKNRITETEIEIHNLEKSTFKNPPIYYPSVLSTITADTSRYYGRSLLNLLKTEDGRNYILWSVQKGFFYVNPFVFTLAGLSNGNLSFATASSRLPAVPDLYQDPARAEEILGRASLLLSTGDVARLKRKCEGYSSSLIDVSRSSLPLEGSGSDGRFHSLRRRLSSLTNLHLDSPRLRVVSKDLLIQVRRGESSTNLRREGSVNFVHVDEGGFYPPRTWSEFLASGQGIVAAAIQAPPFQFAGSTREELREAILSGRINGAGWATYLSFRFLNG